MAAICFPESHRDVEPQPRPALRLLPGGAASGPPRRLDPTVYVRRRLVVLALLVLVVLGLAVAADRVGVLGGSAPASTGDELPDRSFVGRTVHVVQPGETLWSIAEDLAPGADPRPIVDALADLNGGTTVTVGQRLAVPAGT